MIPIRRRMIRTRRRMIRISSHRFPRRDRRLQHFLRASRNSSQKVVGSQAVSRSSSNSRKRSVILNTFVRTMLFTLRSRRNASRSSCNSVNSAARMGRARVIKRNSASSRRPSRSPRSVKMEHGSQSMGDKTTAVSSDGTAHRVRLLHPGQHLLLRHPVRLRRRSHASRRSPMSA